MVSRVTNILTDNAIPLAVLAIIMSIPLLLSYNIKYIIFSQGLPFAFLYFWGLASVVLVPILLLLEIVVLGNLLGSTEIRGGSRELTYTLVAIFAAVASIAVFLIVRNLS